MDMSAPEKIIRQDVNWPKQSVTTKEHLDERMTLPQGTSHSFFCVWCWMHELFHCVLHSFSASDYNAREGVTHRLV